MVKDTTRDAVTAPAAWVGMDKQSRLLREQEAKEREQKRVAAARAAQVPVAQAVAAPHLPGACLLSVCRTPSINGITGDIDVGRCVCV